MKKTLAFILSLVLALSCVSFSSFAAGSSVPGDVDSNGALNSNDAIYLLRYVLFGETYPVSIDVDFNADGKVSSDDAIYLLRHVLFGDLYPITHGVSFTNSESLANVGKYLYRVGNSNAVKLGTLFSALAGTPDPDLVSVTIDSVDPANTTVSGTYSQNASDWSQGTLKFTGEGVVKVTISVSGGAPYVLPLEIVNGKNVLSYSDIIGSGVNVLLNDITIAKGSRPTFTRALYGNGFVIDASAGLTTQAGIITFTGAKVDNVIINGPIFEEYVDAIGKDNYTSTVVCTGAGSVITNCRITGSQSPLRMNSDTLVKDTVLSGGFFCNLEARGGNFTLENVTTVNTQNSLGVVISNSASLTTSVTLKGDFIQHNFVASNTDMGNSNANLLRNVMFRSNYSIYHFVAGSVKYVNTGIISMSPSIGAENIIDLRSDKRNYSGMVASILGNNGYVYTMENKDISMLEKSYTEPEYSPSVQAAYEPVFSWALPASDEAAPGGDSHCYKDTAGVLQIQFPEGSSKTLNAADMATVVKYGKKSIPATVSCKNADTGDSVIVNNGDVTFTSPGKYTLTYSYTDDYIFDKNGADDTSSAVHTKDVTVNVAVKKSGADAEFSVETNSGALVWGTAGNLFDTDYNPCAPFLEGIKIYDHDSSGNTYTVLDGSDQAAFINNVSKATVSGKTVTFLMKNGTRLVVVCRGNIDGSVQIKLSNDKLYFCDSTADNNRGAVVISFTSYTYTGENGIQVVYNTERTFKGAADGELIGTYSSLQTFNS